ncbi:T-box-containing protein TBX6L-like [Diachasmimorpha longicaudata]|uniref:T-box-containing protein TBX6L-like n=1 Tax=Diachasmimorpha longicaudata TaxID=58733 RepID=UPI0030B88475
MNLDMRSYYRRRAGKMIVDWDPFFGSPITVEPVNKLPKSTLPRSVNVQLRNKGLWQQFHQRTTEMIITKLGRRMFPAIEVSIAGLEPQVKYHVFLEIVPVSHRRYKYVGNPSSTDGNEKCKGKRKHQGWTVAGVAEVQSPAHKRLYVHPDSPATGAHWMQQPVGFSKLKLTNSDADHYNNIVLTSMHKYIPKLWIVQADSLGSFRNIWSQPSACFTFDETEFIAVTAYQNESITKLKIDNNPFAKGFRESGHYRCKRKLEENHDNSQGDDPRTPETQESERGEKVERIEVEESKREKGASNCVARLYRPWCTSPPLSPPKTIGESAFPLPEIPQVFNFSTLPLSSAYSPFHFHRFRFFRDCQQNNFYINHGFHC